MMDVKELIKLRLKGLNLKGLAIQEENGNIECEFFGSIIPKLVWNDIKFLWISTALNYKYKVEVLYDCDNEYCSSDDDEYDEDLFDLNNSNIIEFIPRNKLIINNKILYNNYYSDDKAISGVIINPDKSFFNRMNDFLQNTNMYCCFNKFKFVDTNNIGISFSIYTNYNKYSDIIRMLNAIAFAANGEEYDDYLEYGLE